jgi:hypothetical protein
MSGLCQGTTNGLGHGRAYGALMLAVAGAGVTVPPRRAGLPRRLYIAAADVRVS